MPKSHHDEEIALRCACCWARRGGCACSLLEWVRAAEGAGKKKLVPQWAQPLYHYPLYSENTVHLKGFSSVMFVCDGHCGASSTREAYSDFQLYVSRHSCHGRCPVLSRPRPDRRQVPPNGNLHVRSAGNAENLKHRALLPYSMTGITTANSRLPLQSPPSPYILHGHAAITPLDPLALCRVSRLSTFCSPSSVFRSC